MNIAVKPKDFKKFNSHSFSKEFKHATAKRIVDQNVPVSQISCETGVATTSLYRWRSKYIEQKDLATRAATPLVSTITMVQPDNVEELLVSVKTELETIFGFEPTTFQTVKYLVKNWNTNHV